MGTKTGIEWTDSTWSPIRFKVRQDAAAIAREKGYTSLVTIAEKMAGRVGQHCEHVSPGCAHCYAESNNHRCLPANGTGLPYDRRSRDLVEAFVDDKVLLAPLKWKPVVEHSEVCELAWEILHTIGKPRPKCDCPTRPRRIFVENQSDLFAEWVTDEMLDRVHAVMALCPQHTFQVLTKRPERMLAYFQLVEGEKDMERWINAAYGAVEDLSPCWAAAAEELSWPLPNVWLGVSDEGNQHGRIDLLRETPAAARFVSAEPLIFDPGKVNLEGIHWVIVGGESGRGARPMDPAWARSLRDQCKATGTAYFMKQMGSCFGPKKGHELPADLDIKEFPR